MHLARVSKVRWLWCTAAIALAIDQLSKVLVLVGLDLPTRYQMDVMPGFFHLRFAWNTGINFGLLSSNADIVRYGLAALAVGVSMYLVIYVARERRGKWVEMAAGLVVGGAIGNALDRVLYGAVADFLNITCCGIHNPFSFNVADSAIFLGAAGLCVLMWKRREL